MVTGEGFGPTTQSWFSSFLLAFSSFFLYLGMVTGDGYGRRLWGRETERETQRDTSNQAFWCGKRSIWDGEGGRERKRKRETERYLKSTFLGWKDTNKEERERERKRHTETRQSKLLGVGRCQFGTDRAGERERERQRYVKSSFWVERQQFGTERKRVC